MGALIESPHKGVVRALGYSLSPQESLIRSVSVEALDLTFAGVKGDTHEGLTRPACTRVRALHPKGTPIHNERQLTLVSVEELREVAARLKLSALDPRWLGANITLEGLPDLSHLPPSSRLQAPSGLTLVVDLQNHPCSVVTRTIKAEGLTVEGFKAAAEGKRGVTLFVEREGALSVGDELRLFVPTQRAWRGAQSSSTSS